MLLLRLVDALFLVYFWMLLGRIIISWVPELQEYKLSQFVVYYTDPYLNIFRRVIPPIGMIDISPIFAFIAYGYIEFLVKKLIIMLFL